MSESQQSDFASSLYDGDIDTLTYLAPSNQPVTPAQSSSQQTFDVFDSEFLRPVIPLVVPSSLTRVGPDRRKAFVLYNEMTHSDWVDWWLQTDYGRKSKIHWDSSHQSDIWSHFPQVAHGTDGAPKVMCKRCGQILEPPYSLSKGADGKDQRHGLSTMKRHLKTAGCQKANKGHNAEITKFLKKGVGYTMYDYHYYYYFANSLWLL